MIINKQNPYDKFCNDLTDIEFCNNLSKETEFTLHNPGCFIKISVDLYFLKFMPNLEKLVIIGCNFKNIKCIEELKNIKILVLRSANIRNLDFLKDLKYLEELDISDTPVRDFSPMLGLPNLKEVSTVESNASFCIFKHLKNLKMFNSRYIIYKHWRKSGTTNRRPSYIFGPSLLHIRLIKYKNTWLLQVCGDVYSFRGEMHDIMFFLSTLIMEHGIEDLKYILGKSFSTNIHIKDGLHIMFDDGIRL